MANSVTFLLDSLKIGGAELHTLRLARHLSESGLSPSLVVYSSARSEVIADRDLPERTTIVGRGSMKADPIGWVRTGRAIAAFEPDLVIAVNQAAYSVAAIARKLRLFRAPLLCLFHTYLLHKAADHARMRLFKALLRGADGMIFVGERQREAWRAQGLWQGKDWLIRNGIDLHAFAPATPSERGRMRAELDFGEGDFVVGQVGRFRPEKNQALLLDAAAMLRARGVPIRLLFVGDGPCRAEVENKAASLGLSADARFVGERKDVRPWLAAMDVATLCSTTETLPLAAIEALASSVPVVLPDVGGTPEIVRQGENGWLYPVGDSAGLADGLGRLANEEARRPFLEQARPSVAGFDEARMLSEYEALIRSC